MMKTLDVFVEFLFPFHFRLIGVAFLIGGIIPIFPVLSVVLFILSFLLISTHYRIKIDLQNHTLKEYTWIFFIRKGKTVKLETPQYVYINANKKSMNYGRVAQLTSSNMSFSAYLKIKENNAVYLGESTNEKRLLTKAQKFATFLSIPLNKNY
jgi:hypothetical protein